MEKTVAYLYPDAENASSLKLYQDQTNQIKAFYFKKEFLKEVEKLPTSDNYAVYFLFNNSEEDESRIYVGQSMNGVYRMDDHARKKAFWSHCIMFVTDNNSFDKLAIDYLEYIFIQKFKKSSYVLMNKDLRIQEPNVGIYDRPKLNAFIEQIEFLLSVEGIITEIKRPKTNVKYYKAIRHNAKIFVKDGMFIIAKGSEIKRPKESSKNWKGERKFYPRYTRIIDGYVADGKVVEENGRIITQVDLAFKSPSAAGCIISGLSTNGWVFFEGLNELRQENE